MTEYLPSTETVVADAGVPDANVAFDEERLSITTDNNTGQEESTYNAPLPVEQQAQTTSIEEHIEVEAVGLAPTAPPELDVATDPISTNNDFDEMAITDAVAAAAAGSTVDAAVTAHVGDILYNAIDSTVVVNVATNDSLPSAEYFVGTDEDIQQNTIEGELTITRPTTTTTEEQQQQLSPPPLPPLQQQQQQQPSHEGQSTTAMTSAVELVITKTEEKEHNVEIDGAMIAEAAAAAVAAVGDVQLAVDAALAAERNDEGAAAAVAAVAAAAQATEAENTTNIALEVDAEMKKIEQRKRYHENLKSVEEGENPPAKKQRTNQESHEEQLASRRLKDRQRYASMNPEQRQIYNSKRRDQYHRQSENSRQRRRERERERYHSLENDDAKKRNERRAKLERERYQRLTPDNLEAKNSRRRERAAKARAKKATERNNEGNVNAADDPSDVGRAADDLPVDTTTVDTTTVDTTTVAPSTDTTTTTTTAVAPPATAGSDTSTVTGEMKAEENFGNPIHKEDQKQGNATEMVFAANEVEKVVAEVAVEATENRHVSV
mmetsp:Transcript_23873/g.26633  ORF Transcript_23873/g.26633 Transcript_23873/m.26633 type:complete len:550 (+) Transcript_23873:67-1716(+)